MQEKESLEKLVCNFHRRGTIRLGRSDYKIKICDINIYPLSHLISCGDAAVLRRIDQGQWFFSFTANDENYVILRNLLSKGIDIR